MGRGDEVTLRRFARRDVPAGRRLSAAVGWAHREEDWAFVRALFTESNPEFVFIDTSIQKLLEEYASSHGEDEGWIDQIFQVRGGPAPG